MKLVIKMSRKMQTMNVIPWELMDEEREFYNKLVFMEEALQDWPKDMAPR